MISARSLVLATATALGAVAAACAEDDPRRPGDAEPPDPTKPLVCAPVEPGAAPARLLTRRQYDNTLVALLGDTTSPATREFPPENQVLGFQTNAELHRASPLLVTEFLSAAEDVAARAVQDGRVAPYLPCDLDGRGSEWCGETFVERFAARAYRRPLHVAERDALVAFQRATRASSGFRESIQRVIEVVLQAPQFLYRIDSFSAPTEATGAVALGPYEMASRLSYSLWNTMPDDELLAAAAADRLRTPADIEAEARRLVADPRANDVLLDFHRQWLLLDGFDGLVRDAPEFVTYGDQIPIDLRASLEKFIEHVYAEEGATLSALFGSNTVFVNGGLAQVLGVTGIQGLALVPVALPPTERVGLLTQPGLLALLAHPEQSSPIKRGVFLRERILCQELPSPPPTVDQTPPDPDPRLTTRERFKEHTEAPTCAECHVKIDGLGFGLENYDHLGRFRAMESGVAIDASGDIAEAIDPGIEGPFDGPIELGQRLAQSPQVQACVVTQWYRYTMGRLETADDACSLRQVTDAFAASGGDLRRLLVALTTSDAFRFRPPGPEDGS